jgi:nucleotide-binding universal stress UspA family protein
MQPWKRILIAVDHSPYSLRAAEAGFALAQGVHAEIALVYVVNKAKIPVDADLGLTPEESKDQVREEAEKTIEQYIQLYNEVGKVYRFIPEGMPGEEIVRIAGEWGADVIALGTHGRTGLSRMLAGSVAEYVIRHAGVPVLVTPLG